MWARLKATKNSWHQRALERTSRICRLRQELSRERAKNTALTEQLIELRTITQAVKVFNCHYPAQMMALAIFIVLHGGSLRCAAATVGFYSELMGWKYKAPAWRTIPNWVERCGLHCLQNSKKLTGDFRLIVDGSIQMGKEQIMLLLGIPTHSDANSCRNAPLSMNDMVVLGLEVQSSWTGADVATFIKKSLAAHPGINILHFVNDQGTNLLAALRQLKKPWVSDITHVMMNLVRDIFTNDEELTSFCRNIGTLRQQLNLTDWAGLLPPTLRDKDRFLRIFTIVAWAARMDEYYLQLPAEIRDKIAFYRRKRWLLLRLRQVHRLVCLTGQLLRRAGLSDHSYNCWTKQVAAYLATQPQVTKQARAFIAGIEKYFADHRIQYMGSVNGMLCTSEIIESTFGKYKNKGGMRAISSDVLAIPIYNQSITVDYVRQAMQSVSGHDLDQWRIQNVCHNKYGLRKQLNQRLKAPS